MQKQEQVQVAQTVRVAVRTAKRAAGWPAGSVASAARWLAGSVAASAASLGAISEQLPVVLFTCFRSGTLETTLSRIAEESPSGPE